MASDKKGEPIEKPNVDRGGKDGEFAENHSSLQNQSVVKPEDYTDEYREQQAIGAGMKPKK